MITTYFRRIACGAALVAATSGTFANSVQRADLPAEPAWVLHVDLDGLRATTIGQFIMSELEKPENQDKLAALQTIFNFDPRRQLHGLTLYSNGKTPADGVLLVYADFDADRLTTLAKGANNHQSTMHNQHVIHSWTDEHKHRGDGAKPDSFGAIYAGRVVVLGQREARVAEALDALDHLVPTLPAEGPYAHLGAQGTHTFIQCAATKLDMHESDPSAALFKLAKHVSLDVAESDRQLTAILALQAKDEDVAKYMTSVGQGLLALAKLQSGKPEAAKFLDSLSLTQQEGSVVATLSMPASQAVEMIKNDAARHTKKNAEKKPEKY